MGRLSLIPAQAAIRTLLLADGVLTGLTGNEQRVFDGVPDDQAYPYVTFGEKRSQPWDTFDRDGNEDTIEVYVWSQARGDNEAVTIASRICDLLHGAALDLSSDDFDTVLLQREFTDTMREPDGRTRRCISRFKIITQEAAS